jgi:hypothetical protein
MIGSLLDLTFPVKNLGSNLNIFKTITEGNNSTCQELEFSKKPIVIFNQELCKRQDGKKNTIEIFKVLKYANILNSIWNGLNMLNSSLHDGGINYLHKFLPFSAKDLYNFSSFYFLNLSAHKISSFKKIVNLKLSNTLQNKYQQNYKQIFFDQNRKLNINYPLYDKFYLNNEKKLVSYLTFSSSTFYENNETFINTEGLIKRVTKMILQTKTKNTWQIVRRIFKHLTTNLLFLNKKEKFLIFFNSNKLTDFKNYINFQYQITQTLTNMNLYLTIKNNTFINTTNNNLNVKQKISKFISTKIRYWLDDFFNGGKDEYSQYSLILTNCSKILRSETTNFF